MADDTTLSADGDLLETDDPETLTEAEYEEVTAAEPEAAPISYSGTDFDADGLVRRLNRGDIVIPSFGHRDPTLEVAGFQRSFVWRRPQMDRFIESLLLGYPIPGIILVQQTDKKYLVLDGQQRLRTLQAYYAGIHEKREFALENVAAEFRGLTYSSLPPELRRQVDNTFIQATIVKTDGSLESLEAIYQVFERLNSGGTQLTPHEIRIALYPGPFVQHLAQLNELHDWRALYGAISPRLRDQEVILRILAMYLKGDMYVPPLKKFLNTFLGANRYLADIPVVLAKNGLGVKGSRIRDVASELFRQSARLLLEAEGRQALRYQSRQVNAALTEAVFVGLMRRLATDSAANLPSITQASISAALSNLTQDSAMTAAISRATANEEAVRTRIGLATDSFASS
jgi:Protein of unknown function DUF262